MTLRQRLKCLFYGCQIKTISFQRLKDLEEEIENAPDRTGISMEEGALRLVDWFYNRKPKQDDNYTIDCDSKDAKDGAN